MRTFKQGLFLTVFLIFPVIFQLFPNTADASSCGEWAGRLVSLQGDVQVMRTGSNTWEPLAMQDLLFSGDMVRVGPLSRAAIYLCNDATLRLDQNSTLTFPAVNEDAPLMIRMMEGIGHFFSRFPRSLDIVTPFVNGAVEGTEFLLAVAADQTQITVYEGRVTLSNDIGSLSVNAGERAVAKIDRAPEYVAIIRPRDAVHWALYYPAVMEVTPDDFPAANSWHESVRVSIDDYRHGDLIGAFDSIATLPDTIDDPLFYAYRAMLLMAVGRTGKAESEIQKALAIDPSYARAFALKSVIALVQNNKTQAMEWAKKAEAAEPLSPTAQIALSYANQAHFDLETALSNIQEAVRLAPDNALVHTRLAELWQSFGNLDKAESAAKRAAALNPDLAHTHTILGFVHLAKIDTARARESFDTAVELDPAAPLPRLGLGLASIKEGDLDDGRQQIEIAVSLDPNNSLIRSYLGKAYYDEKRDEKSGNQLSVAKELDPNDPTPWLYDAIRKQTENRPVEALKDLQKSIKLNDNRAVYRSRLLLDEDQAVRSASLGRIYQDLGFDQMALNEGFKSVNTDPGNHSAHRFLADNYATLPRHEIARVSELLQSQLLQPINITPIQPQLAETSLFVHQGTGPSAPSFNEFTNLYERDRLSAQLNGVAGGNDTWGDDVVVSALWKNYSLSAGQYHFESDGFRENNDQEQDIYNVFGQVALSHDTSVQAEYRYKEVDKGDLSLRFDPEDFLDNFDQRDIDNTVRGGVKHSFSPGSDFICSVIYGKTDTDWTLIDTISLGPIDSEMEIQLPTYLTGYVAEAQHIYKTDNINLVSGIGYYHTKKKDEFNFLFDPEIPSILTNSYSSETVRTNHSYLYLYSTFNYIENFSWTIGGTANFFDDDTFEDKKTINPKIGAIWAPTTKTTIRAAIFKSFTRNPVSRQTIEPTQIAGFNQFYRDGASTESWRYGLGIDQMISEIIFGGVELSRRDLEVPYIDAQQSGEVKKAKENEEFYRLYLYFTPFNCISFSLEYLYEQTDRDKDAPFDDIKEVSTNRVPIGLNIFLPEGITLSTKATYVSQTGEFGDPRIGFESDNDKFWVVDAGISYRLPKRFGTISLEAKNLFDESFKFQDTEPENPSIYPEQLILGKITLAF